MRRPIILVALLLYPAAAYAQLGGSAPLFAVGIERATLQDSTDPRAALRVWLESSKEIPAAEFTISYDPGKLKALEVSPGGPLEPFSIFEKDLETPGRVEILAADFSGETIPAGKTENLFTVSFAVLPGAGKGEYAVSLTKAVLADPEAGRYFPSVAAGAVINPFSGVADRSYGYYGSDYAFWVNGRNDSPISFYLNNRRPVSALELRVAYNPEVSEYLGFYDEPRMQQMETREVAQGEGYLSLVIADFSGNSIAPGTQKLFTVSFTSTNDPSAYFYIENFIMADTAANRITPKVFYQDSYSPFETVTADTTAARPRMVLSATEVSFGQVPVGQATSKKIIILNLGEADLVVSRISSSSSVFTAGMVSATIPPRTSLDIAVSCRPTAEQDYTGTLIITTGDGTAEVALTGTGSAGPEPPGCDFNGDGRITVSDVIALLLFQRANPGDLRADFNRDGNINVVDAVAMLLAMRDGTCPDAGTLQE